MVLGCGLRVAGYGLWDDESSSFIADSSRLKAQGAEEKAKDGRQRVKGLRQMHVVEG
jgi:hypothetical protein